MTAHVPRMPGQIDRRHSLVPPPDPLRCRAIKMERGIRRRCPDYALDGSELCGSCLKARVLGREVTTVPGAAAACVR